MEEFEAKEGHKLESVVIIDDFVGTGKQLCYNVYRFLASNGWLRETETPIIVVAIAATKKGMEAVEEYIGKICCSAVKFRACEILDDRHIAFEKRNRLWEGDDDRNKAKSICLNIGAHIYRDNPLGFGEQGLLVVFPTTVPK